MTIRPVTQKDLKIYAKRGFTLAQVAEKHGLQVEEVETAIHKLFGHRFSAQILKEFERNLKGPVAPKSPAPPPIIAAQPILENAAIENNTPEAEDPSPETTVLIQEALSPEMLLERLRAQESTLSDQIIAIESEHKALASTHRANIKKLREYESKLLAIKQEFEKINAEYEAFAENNNGLVAKMATLKDQCRISTRDLSDVRAQISELETITVCVYTDGTLEPLEGIGDLTLDDTGSDEIYKTLIHDFDFCQDLRLKDILTLARLKAIVKNSSRKILPLFDDNALEPKFQQLQLS